MFNQKFLENHYRGAVYGAAIGDALGVPWEFCGRGACHCAGMASGGVHGQEAGVWSDDTALLIATGDSLKANGGNVDVDDMRMRFNSWMRTGEYAIGHNVFDIGGTVSQALSSGSGRDGERDNGNGSLMRILPIAFTDADAKTVSAASAITHAHRISCEACVIYVGIARSLMSGMSVEEAVQENLSDAVEFARLGELDSMGEDEISSGGYVVHTLEAALWSLLHSGSYREGVLRAVNLGGDADTTACVAGGLAGIVYGFDGIPGEWVDALRGKDLIEGCMPTTGA